MKHRALSTVALIAAATLVAASAPATGWVARPASAFCLAQMASAEALAAAILSVTTLLASAASFQASWEAPALAPLISAGVLLLKPVRAPPASLPGMAGTLDAEPDPATSAWPSPDLDEDSGTGLHSAS